MEAWPGHIKGSQARRRRDNQQVWHPGEALSHSCGQSGVAAWEGNWKTTGWQRGLCQPAG